MTIANLPNYASFTGTGSVGPFTFSFVFLEDSEISVEITDLLGIVVLLTQNVDYVVAGAGNNAGGSVTLMTALTTGWTLEVKRTLPLEQSLELPDQGPFFAPAIEAALDYLTMICQQLDRAIKLGLIGPPGYSGVWIVAAGVPADGTGNNGDMYINSTTFDIYGPKAGGAWGSIVCNIKGAAGPGYGGTSVTSVTIGTGSKTFATQAGLAYLAGDYVRIVDSADASKWMEGQVTSYSGTSLVVTVTLTNGSGTIATWNISLAGVPGQTGATGPVSLPIIAAAGTVDAITATYSPAITLADLQLAGFVATGANATTTPTFAPNGLTAHTITKKGGQALAAGDIPAQYAVCILEYNLANTRWELLNPASAAGTSFASAAEAIAFTEAAKAIAPLTMLIPNYFTGLGLSHAADTDHDITCAVGWAMDTTNVRMLVLASPITKQDDATWATGTNAGGMAAGESIPVSGTIHWWLMGGAAVAVDMMCNNHATTELSPTLPAGYTWKRLIGSYRTDSSSKIINGDWWGTGLRRKLTFDTPILDVNVNNPGGNAITAALSTPAGIVTSAFLRAELYGNVSAFAFNISALNNADIAPLAHVLTVDQSSGTVTLPKVIQKQVETNTSSQIRYKLDASASGDIFQIATLGYEMTL